MAPARAAARTGDGRERLSLRAGEFVIGADEKTGIQARVRLPPSLPPEPKQPMCGGEGGVEHEYRRGGAWARLAALDVHRAKLFGRCEATAGIAPFERLVDPVKNPWPYHHARRVFEWRFTRADLNALLVRMRSGSAQTQPLKLAA